VRRGVKTGMISGVLTVVVGTAGYGAFTIHEGLTSGDDGIGSSGGSAPLAQEAPVRAKPLTSPPRYSGRPGNSWRHGPRVTARQQEH